MLGTWPQWHLPVTLHMLLPPVYVWVQCGAAPSLPGVEIPCCLVAVCGSCIWSGVPCLRGRGGCRKQPPPHLLLCGVTHSSGDTDTPHHTTHSSVVFGAVRDTLCVCVCACENFLPNSSPGVCCGVGVVVHDLLCESVIRVCENAHVCEYMYVCLCVYCVLTLLVGCGFGSAERHIESMGGDLPAVVVV